MKSKPVVLTGFIWLALTIAFATLGVRALDWQKWQNLTRYGVETKGRVTGKEPDNHNFIRYSYVVGQRTHFGLVSAGNGNPDFDQLNVGDVIRVFYYPDEPEESILGNPESQARSSTNGVLFLGILGPLFSMIGLYAKGWLPVSK